MQIYFSELIGIPIKNKSGEKIGVLVDVVTTDISKPRPMIHGLILKRGFKKDLVFIPYHDIEEISKKSIRLSTDVVDLKPFIQRPNEIRLADNVYDKQIVDIDDRRLTRVNELLFEAEKNSLYLAGVDVSMFGIMRRLGIPQIGIIKPNLVDWADVQFLGGQMKFNVQYKNLESLHPVDIGRIIFEGPGYKQGSKVLAALKDPIAADIIEELSPKLQKNLIESMKLEDVADVIKHMPPDKAADLVLTLGPDYAKKILPLLAEREANEIKSLLVYPEHTTGAYMTTDYLAVAGDATLDEAFEHIRNIPELPDFTYYMYVLENKYSNKLVGILAAHEFLKANPRSRINSIMTKKTFIAYPTDHIKKSLRKMYRYNISALPVINNRTEGRLLGIITFRNAITIYLPNRWKQPLNRVA